MPDETEIAASEVAEIIADQAAEIVADNNDAVAQAEAVTEAVLEAAVKSAEIQRFEEIEHGLLGEISRLGEVVAHSNLRIEECERTMATLQTAQAEILTTLATLSIPAQSVSPSPSEDVAVLENQTAETVEPEGLQQTEAAPPNVPEPPKRRRHLI